MTFCSSCFLFYEECEERPSDEVLQANIAGEEESIKAWYNIPIHGKNVNIYRPNQVIEHKRYLQLLGSLGISEKELGISGKDTIVSVSYFFENSTCINTLQDINCLEGVFVYFVKGKTLHTRFFHRMGERPQLIENVNATPKYLSSQIGFKALKLMNFSSDTINYLQMVHPSVANRAREGKINDFIDKVDLYLDLQGE
jgi:hypothetical protein